MTENQKKGLYIFFCYANIMTSKGVQILSLNAFFYTLYLSVIIKNEGII